MRILQLIKDTIRIYSTKVQTLGALRMRDTVMGGPDARGEVNGGA